MRVWITKNCMLNVLKSLKVHKLLKLMNIFSIQKKKTHLKLSYNNYIKTKNKFYNNVKI